MSDSEEEDHEYALYGTLLDPIEEDEVQARKPINVQDQIATDKHGKRRFHGAFTGGFSAGFCNTVGSLEGWTPATFKSSRSDKASSSTSSMPSITSSQKPEDFMDDEDMSAFGIAPKAIQIASSFEGNSGTQSRRQKHRVGTIIPGVPVLETLLQPAQDTIGVKLLSRMGWKPGQGIGPRLTKREKQVSLAREKSRPKVYGCSMPGQEERSGLDDDNREDRTGEEEEEGMEEEDENGFTYAPSEYLPYLVKPKDNEFGLGYKGLDKTPVLSSDKRGFSLFDMDDPGKGPSINDKGVTFIGRNNKKVQIHGQAFGVGAFEVEDEDIYATEDMSRYDTSLAPSGTRSRTRDPKTKSRPETTKREGELEGFRRSETQSLFMKVFPPPILPPNFTPKAPASSHLSLQNSSPLLVPKVEPDHPIRQAKSVFERAAILDEPLPIVRPLSVPSTNEKAPVSNGGPVGTNEATATNDLRSGPITAGVSDGKTFRPFASEPDKQKRYEQYITFVKLGMKDKLSGLQPKSMTEWEKQREAQEFASAHALYLPLSGAMADRFTRGSQPDDTNPLVKVERTVEPGDETLKNAAKNKMFGKLTRELSVWVPSDLLCKRFNIKPPVFDYRNPAAIQKKRRNNNYSLFEFLNAPSTPTAEPTEQPSPSQSDPNTTGPDRIQNSEVDRQRVPQNDRNNRVSRFEPESNRVPKNVTPGVRLPNPLRDEDDARLAEQTVAKEGSRLEDIPLTAENKVDLFKAIFLSSDEEDEDDNDKSNDKANPEPSDKTENQEKLGQKNKTDNKEVERKGIDKDDLKEETVRMNDGKATNDEKTSEKDTAKTVGNKADVLEKPDNPMKMIDKQVLSKASANRDDTYGPQLPSQAQPSLSRIESGPQLPNQTPPLRTESKGHEKLQGEPKNNRNVENTVIASEEIFISKKRNKEVVGIRFEKPSKKKADDVGKERKENVKVVEAGLRDEIGVERHTEIIEGGDVSDEKGHIKETGALEISDESGTKNTSGTVVGAKEPITNDSVKEKAINIVEEDDEDMWVDADENVVEEGHKSVENKRKSRKGVKSKKSKKHDRSDASSEDEKRRKSRRKRDGTSSESEKGRTSKRDLSTKDEKKIKSKRKYSSDSEEEKRHKSRRKRDSSSSSEEKGRKSKRDLSTKDEKKIKSKRNYSSDSEEEKRHKSRRKRDSSSSSGEKGRKSKRYSSSSSDESISRSVRKGKKSKRKRRDSKSSDEEKRRKSRRKRYSSSSEDEKRHKSKRKHKKHKRS